MKKSKSILFLPLACTVLLYGCGNKSIDVKNLDNATETSVSKSIETITQSNNSKLDNKPAEDNTNKSNTNTDTESKAEGKTENKTEDKNQSNAKPNTVGSSVDVSKLSTKEQDWFFEPKKEGIPSTVPKNISDVINKYSTYFIGDTSKKILYLTFDEGYENGYSSKILDILKANNVKAAFFVTNPYMKSNPDLIKRMEAEGHLVCNHTDHHPSMAQVAASDKSKFEKEITTVETTYEQITGKKMPKFFRPPMGKYSELSLYYTNNMGYKTIFWSSAYGDWDINKQPSHEYAKNIIKQRTHNGAIILLHAVSKTNTEILDSLIKDWKSQGYELTSLDKLT